MGRPFVLLILLLSIAATFLTVSVTVENNKLVTVVENLHPVPYESLLELAKNFLPDASSLNGIHFGIYEEYAEGKTAYRIFNSDIDRIGYAVIVEEDIICEVCEDLFLAVFFNSDLVILGIIQIDEFGVCREPADGSDFLDQFIGMTKDDPLRLGETIAEMSEAPELSGSILEAVKETFILVDLLH